MGDTSRDLGLLLLRVGIGGIFMAHGWPKLLGGPKTWEQLGKAMSHFGIDFAPTFFGFMATAAELFGGLLIALGVLFRSSLVLLIATMVVALWMHLAKGDDFVAWSNSAKALVVFAALFLTGPGRHRLAFPRKPG